MTLIFVFKKTETCQVHKRKSRCQAWQQTLTDMPLQSYDTGSNPLTRLQFSQGQGEKISIC